jgi:hypothetical protein
MSPTAHYERILLCAPLAVPGQQSEEPVSIFGSIRANLAVFVPRRLVRSPHFSFHPT